MIRSSQSSLQEDLDCKKIRASIDIVLITYLSTIPWRHIYLLVALTESRLFSRQLSDGFLSAFSRQPKISRFPWKKVAMKPKVLVNKLHDLMMLKKFSISLKNFEKKIFA